jgi:hypothetical protein
VAYRSAEGISIARKGEATENIAFIFAISFFPRFLSKKTHVKPQNHLPNQTKVNDPGTLPHTNRYLKQ